MKTFTFAFVFLLSLACFCVKEMYAQTDSTFKPSGKFSMVLFGDYMYKLHADALNRGISQYSAVPKSFSNFQLRRLYFGYNYDISPAFTTEFVLAYEDGGGASATLDGGGERSFYLKYANIRWKNVFANTDIIFGAQATPAFAASSEKIWGYRAIEKTLLDKNKIASASDVGIALQGWFDEKNFGYDILYGNGSAQKLEADKFKKISGDLWGKFMEKKITLQLYGDLNRASDAPAKDISTLKLFLGYQSKPLTIGVEGFMQTQTNAIIRDTRRDDSTIFKGSIDTMSVKPFGLSAFAVYEVIENSLNVFVRYDMFDPDNNFDESAFGYFGGSYSKSKENFFVAGLDWTPHMNVHIMPNFWYTGYFAKAAGAFGPEKFDKDIVARVTVSFKI